MNVKQILEDLDYLFKKINWGASFLDARAAQIMNEISNNIAALEPEIHSPNASVPVIIERERFFLNNYLVVNSKTNRWASLLGYNNYSDMCDRIFGEGQDGIFRGFVDLENFILWTTEKNIQSEAV